MSATSKMSLSVLFIFLFLGIFNANSQTVYYDSINKKKYAKIDIHQTYERVIQKGYESIEMLEYLGNYYYKDKDFQKSKLYFDMLFRKYKLAQISTKSIDQYNKLINNRI
jgi:lipoprotein NlpI